MLLKAERRLSGTWKASKPPRVKMGRRLAPSDHWWAAMLWRFFPLASTSSSASRPRLAAHSKVDSEPEHKSLGMATTALIGAGAVAAAFAARSLLRRAGTRAAEEWVKGGFKAKMDRREAIEILGLKCVYVRCILSL